MARTCYVYLLSNRRRTVFYTGVTGNLTRRLEQHLAGTGSVFTSRHHATDLLYFETYDHSLDAIAREKQIKRWRLEKKIFLIRKDNPQMKDLKWDL